MFGGGQRGKARNRVTAFRVFFSCGGLDYEDQTYLCESLGSCCPRSPALLLTPDSTSHLKPNPRFLSVTEILGGYDASVCNEVSPSPHPPPAILTTVRAPGRMRRQVRVLATLDHLGCAGARCHPVCDWLRGLTQPRDPPPPRGTSHYTQTTLNYGDHSAQTAHQSCIR